MTIEYMQTDPRADKYGELIREVVKAEFTLRVCDKCREKNSKMDKTKQQLVDAITKFARNRAKKKLRILGETVCIAWNRKLAEGPPAPPPGVEMEITWGKDGE